MLKIIVTRGSATRRGYAPDAEVPRRIVSLYDTPALAAELRNGVDLIYATGSVAEHPGLAGLKHCSRLENVWAMGEARAVAAFDAVMRTAAGHLVSGAMTNLFTVGGGKVRTPPRRPRRAWRASCGRSCCANARPWASRCGADTADRADVQAADEMFITNARIGVVPVRRVGEHRFRMNAVARRLAATSRLSMRKLLLIFGVLLLLGAGAAAIYWRHMDAAMTERRSACAGDPAAGEAGRDRARRARRTRDDSALWPTAVP